MASKREDQEGDIVDLTPIKRQMHVQKGSDLGALLSIVSFD